MGTLGRMVYMAGSLFRASGQAMDRVGHFVQGGFFTPEHFSKHRTVMNIFEKSPNLHKDVFIAPCAAVIGDVKIDTKSSIWYGCVLRGDVNSISIGSGTNIQDNATVHVAKVNAAGKESPTIIGNNVTVGHGAVLHACTIEDEAFIGMGATLLDGVCVEKNAMVGAGSIVKPNTRIPSGEIWAGTPAQFLRKLSEEEISFISQAAANYRNLAARHAWENGKCYEHIEADKLMRKKIETQCDDYDSRYGVHRVFPPELLPPDRVSDTRISVRDSSI